MSRFVAQAVPLVSMVALVALVGAGVWFQSSPARVRAEGTAARPQAAAAPLRKYVNKLTPIENPAPLLNDYPEFVQPIIESRRFEAPILARLGRRRCLALRTLRRQPRRLGGLGRFGGDAERPGEIGVGLRLRQLGRFRQGRL